MFVSVRVSGFLSTGSDGPGRREWVRLMRGLSGHMLVLSNRRATRVWTSVYTPGNRRTGLLPGSRLGRSEVACRNEAQRKWARSREGLEERT